MACAAPATGVGLVTIFYTEIWFGECISSKVKNSFCVGEGEILALNVHRLNLPYQT